MSRLFPPSSLATDTSRFSGKPSLKKIMEQPFDQSAFDGVDWSDFPDSDLNLDYLFQSNVNPYDHNGPLYSGLDFATEGFEPVIDSIPVDQPASDDIDWSEFLDFDLNNFSQSDQNPHDQVDLLNSNLSFAAEGFESSTNFAPINFNLNLNDPFQSNINSYDKARPLHPDLSLAPEGFALSMGLLPVNNIGLPPPGLLTTIDPDQGMANTGGQDSPDLIHHIENPQQISDDHLKLKFKQALQAIQGGAKRGASPSDDDNSNGNAAFQKFSLKIPSKRRKTNQKGPRRERKRKSDPPSCLPCRILKRKCTPGENCARCIESCLGSRDLAFTRCLRDNPLKFNPFSVDDSDARKLDSKSCIPVWVLIIYFESKPSTQKFLAALSCISFIQSGNSFLSSFFPKKPGKRHPLEMAQYLISQKAFQILEDAINSRSSDQRKAVGSCIRRKIVLYLYIWLDEFEFERENSATLEAAGKCKQYLLEYLRSEVSSLRLAPSSSCYGARVVMRQIVDPANTRDLLHLINAMALLLPCYTPKTAAGVRECVLNGAESLMPAAAHIVSSKLSISLTEAELQISVHSIQPESSPRVGNAYETLGIWSLFWRQIPVYVRELLNFSQNDFLSILLEYGSGSFLTEMRHDLRHKPWTNWMMNAQYWQGRICRFFVLAASIEWLSAEDSRVMRLSHLYFEAPGDLYVQPESGKLTSQMADALRWSLVFQMVLHDLLEVEAFQTFVEDLISSKNALSAKFTRPGFGLYLKILKELHQWKSTTSSDQLMRDSE